MKIKYGIKNNNIDVTDICLKKLVIDGIIVIPSGDMVRASYFTDPLKGVLKSIFIEHGETISEYKDYQKIQIEIEKNTIEEDTNFEKKLEYIHSQLKMVYGNLKEELPEQKMVVRNLTGKEKVLEIGANLGRNTMVISSILAKYNNTDFVTLESDTEIAKKLNENKELNNLQFHIENAALSKRKLIQRGWNTIPSEVLLKGYSLVNTITLEELKSKYNIVFDTLIMDCEGAFYFILLDMPEILDNITMIIMENDYFDITKKQYIDNILKKNNFYRDYVEPGGWGPCEAFFYEVWKK